MGVCVGITKYVLIKESSDFWLITELTGLYNKTRSQTKSQNIISV